MYMRLKCPTPLVHCLVRQSFDIYENLSRRRGKVEWMMYDVNLGVTDPTAAGLRRALSVDEPSEA